MRNVLNINLNNKKYPIIIESGLFSSVGSIIGEHYIGKKIVIVTDESIFKFHGQLLTKQMDLSGCQWDIITLPSGEDSKNFEVLPSIYSKLIEFEMTRDDVIVSIGGGVIGDIAGFAAATFLRGIEFIQIPTTLLGQVDSSIGGKCAVHLKEAKNVVGTFYQPSFVLIDPDFVKTLSDFDMQNGMAEIIKYAAVSDSELFYDLKRMSNNRKADLIETIIYRCCLIKKQMIEQDEKDYGIRMLSNFGHTLGHAIENMADYQNFGHGHAVAIGMQIVTEHSEKLGLSGINTSAMLKELLEEFGLPTKLPDGIDKEKLITSAMLDKKRRGDKINLVLLEKIGKGYIYPIEKSELEKFVL